MPTSDNLVTNCRSPSWSVTVQVEAVEIAGLARSRCVPRKSKDYPVRLENSYNTCQYQSLHLTRIIQCDEGRPTCGQCTKSKKICLGYDRSAGVAFRDETRTTEKKAGKGERKKSLPLESPLDQTASIPQSSTRSRRNSAWTASTASYGFVEAESYNPLDVSPDTPYKTPTFSSNFIDFDQFDPIPSIEAGPTNMSQLEMVPLNLPQDPEQQSICFFMSKFVQDSRTEEIWGGSLEALPTTYNRVGANSPLSLATAATSMSSVAWNPECAQFKPVALQKYVKSLKLLNDAVQDPGESKSDGVLMAVLMLGFYEVSNPGRFYTYHPEVVQCLPLDRTSSP